MEWSVRCVGVEEKSRDASEQIEYVELHMCGDGSIEIINCRA